MDEEILFTTGDKIMNTDRQIKLLVRSLLVMASFWMVVGNMHSKNELFVASVLFLSANVLSLVYNEIKRK
jgi:4-hydroxybenzoate polyprenyltransferase